MQFQGIIPPMVGERENNDASLPRISDFLPEIQSSAFIRHNRTHVEMLLRISEILGSNPELNFNRAVSQLPFPFYGKVVGKGLRFSEVSKAVGDYLQENPQLADNLAHLLKTEVVDDFGYIRGPISDISPLLNMNLQTSDVE